MRLMMRALCLGVGSVGVLLTTAGVAVAAPPVGARSYSAGKYALEIGGVMAGWITSVEGGHATADVVEEKGPEFYAKKHLANVQYRAIIFEVGPSNGAVVFDWIKASLEGNFQRKNGAIIAVDYQYRIKSRREFFDALITEVDFPELDAASKNPVRIRVVLQPAYTRMSTAGLGTTLQVPLCKSPLLLSSNFHFLVESIDTSKVRGVAPLSVKILLSEGGVGDQRDYEPFPSKVSFPNVLVTVPQSGLQGFDQWFEDFVIQGNNSDEGERTGSLEYLTPNLSEALFKLDFFNLGIFEIEPQVASSAENIPVSVVKMYVERMEFTQTAPSCGAR